MILKTKNPVQSKSQIKIMSEIEITAAGFEIPSMLLSGIVECKKPFTLYHNGLHNVSSLL